MSATLDVFLNLSLFVKQFEATGGCSRYLVESGISGPDLNPAMLGEIWTQAFGANHYREMREIARFMPGLYSPLQALQDGVTYL